MTVTGGHKFDWTYEVEGTRFLILNILFEEPETVSVETEDSVFIQFHAPYTFVSIIDDVQIDPESQVLSYVLPNQIDVNSFAVA